VGFLAQELWDRAQKLWDLTEVAAKIALLGVNDMLQGIMYPAKGAGGASIQELVAESRAQVQQASIRPKVMSEKLR